jgi:hypothetical protein
MPLEDKGDNSTRPMFQLVAQEDLDFPTHHDGNLLGYSKYIQTDEVKIHRYPYHILEKVTKTHLASQLPIANSALALSIYALSS